MNTIGINYSKSITIYSILNLLSIQFCAILSIIILKYKFRINNWVGIAISIISVLFSTIYNLKNNKFIFNS